jgi:hypothetical protein
MAVSTEQALAHNARQVGHSDMDDRGDALQIVGQRIGDRYYVYCGHLWSSGRNPFEPREVAWFIPPATE